MKASMLFRVLVLAFISSGSIGCRQAMHSLRIHPVEQALAKKYGPSFYAHSPYYFGIDSPSFNDNDLNEAVPLLKLASIESVAFKNSSLTDQSADSFAKLSCLQDIDVQGSTEITDSWVPGLVGLDKLRFVNVIDTNVTADAATWLLRNSSAQKIYGGSNEGYRKTIYIQSTDHPKARIDWRFESEAEYTRWLVNQENVYPK